MSEDKFQILRDFAKSNNNPSKTIYQYIKEVLDMNSAYFKENQSLKNQLSNSHQIKNQQKEFIKYMNKTIEELECDDVDDEELKGYLLQRIYTFKEILSKFKEIIGVYDEIQKG